MHQEKRRKIEEISFFDCLPAHIIIKILRYMTISDLKNFSMTNSFFNEAVSHFMKKRTYLYICKRNEKVSSIPDITREFSEIFFHGMIEKDTIDKILRKFSNRAHKLTFGKNDLKFLKPNQIEIMTWLNYTKESLQVLNTLNIEIEANDFYDKITLPNLKKLRCCDTMLNVLKAPILEDIVLHSKDYLATRNLHNINDFLTSHHSIKKFSFILFCGEDTDVQNVDFKLDHLQLTHLKMAEFRYNPRSVLTILKSQKNLVNLYLGDGYLTHEDVPWGRQLEPIFDEILNLINLEKLMIEMPTVKFIKDLKKLPNLKRLHINVITFDALDIIKSTQFPKIQKLCIESIDFGKSSLKNEDVWLISKNFKNITTLKFDVAPLSVIDSILRHFENLRVIKIIKNRNKDLVKNLKSKHNEVVELPQTNLEQIICDQEDFKLKILPIIKASPKLKHVKIHWSNKNTPFMTIVFEILEYCLQINLIEFKYGEIYAKDDLIPFKSHFSFSFNNRNYQMINCRKNGDIKCCKV